MAPLHFYFHGCRQPHEPHWPWGDRAQHSQRPLSDRHDNFREDKWTGGIAVGSKRFIGDIKTIMGGMARGEGAWKLENHLSFEKRKVPISIILGPKRAE